MTELYAVLAGLGTLIILVQLLGGSPWGHVDHDVDADHAGLHLTNLRAISVGLATFGFAGLILGALGVLGWLVLGVALLAGGAGLLLTAWIFMRVARLEEDASVRIADTLGERGTVYVPIAQDAAGRVQVMARGRTMEYRAVADHPLATGTPVLITGLRDDQTVEVEPA
jgi:membrane protein implicated in regulation of membrane protease activity